jgi:hypothetical protein
MMANPTCNIRIVLQCANVPVLKGFACFFMFCSFLPQRLFIKVQSLLSGLVITLLHMHKAYGFQLSKLLKEIIMEKYLSLAAILACTSTAALAGVPGGEATYHVNLETKSTASRAEVLANTDSASMANVMDSTVSPKVEPSTMLSRAEVIRKMEGYKFADFGDGTSLQPWVKKLEAPRALATQEVDSPAVKAN